MTREDCKKLTDSEFNWLGTFALKAMKPKMVRMLIADELKAVESRIQSSPAHCTNNGADRVDWFWRERPEYTPEEWSSLCRRLDGDIQYRNMLGHMYVALG